MAENDTNPENQPAASNPEAAPDQNIAIRTVYLKDSSFESPNAPAIFQENVQPKFNINVNSGVSQVQENVHEVVLTLAITATNESEDKTVFHTEVQQAGIFESIGFSDQQLHQILGTFAPSQLFPYAREAVNSLIIKAVLPVSLYSRSILMRSTYNICSNSQHSNKQRQVKTRQ